MTIQGHDSTLPVCVGRYRLPRTRAVRLAPTLSTALRPAVYEARHPEQACENMTIVMRAGANMVK